MVRDRLKEQKPGKSAGPDGIHSRVVVETQEQLVRPLTIIFNKSLSQGVQCLSQELKKVRHMSHQAEKGETHVSPAETRVSPS